MSRLVGTAFAAGLPFGCYLATASAHGYWFDAGGMVAAAESAGISHPPGHPLAGLVTFAATLVPLGPIPLRVAIASALLAAVAAAFLYRAIDTTVRAVGLGADRVAVPVAVAATWAVAFSYGWWFQAVRPEVYALSAALVCIAVERVVALEAAWPAADLRPLYAGAVAIGLGLANHHFLALLALPAAAPLLARAYRARGIRPLLYAAAGVVTGLLTYLYLPFRAAAGPYLDLGDPTTPERFTWVVSAEAFHKNTGSGVPEPWLDRLLQVFEQLVDSVQWPVLILATLGLYALLRTPGAPRRLALVWVLLLVVHVGARAWLGFVRDNPDAAGYLMPGFGALGALAAAFVAIVLREVAGRDARRPRAIAVVLAVLLAMGALWPIPESAARASLAGFTASDAFDDDLRRSLPPRAVFLAHDPQTIFRFWGGEATERLRPDVMLVPIPFIRYPGMIDRLLAEDPSLREPLSAVLVDDLLAGELRQPALQSLASERPVLVEMDVRVPPRLYETLVPNRLAYEVLADGATDADEQEGAETQRAALARLLVLLGEGRDEPETRNRLLWRHYCDALYYAGFGDRDQARRSLGAALQINPDDLYLQGLSQALSDPEATGPIDVTPFVPGGPP